MKKQRAKHLRDRKTETETETETMGEESQREEQRRLLTYIFTDDIINRPQFIKNPQIGWQVKGRAHWDINWDINCL